uniref:DAGKc domain-containing protein n=1 Tax=Steinernema glaseri TaxID=37863 RepID=A0A1I7Y0U1_9BILA
MYSCMKRTIDLKVKPLHLYVCEKYNPGPVSCCVVFISYSGIATMGGICCAPCHPRKNPRVADAGARDEIHTVESPTGRFLIFANPNSGEGKSVAVFRKRLKPELVKNNIAYELIVTTHAQHAFSVIRARNDLHEFNAILILSGDGLVFEVINGLVLRPDHDRFFPHLPLGIVPSGSGNGLLASVYHTKSYPLKGNEFLKQALRSVSQVDATAHIVSLTHVETDNGENTVSFLSIGWALMADIDIESERWRRPLGSARFTAGAVIRCINLRKYRAKLSYLPSTETSESSVNQRTFPVFERELTERTSKCASSSGDTINFSDYHVKPGVPKLAEPVPDNWVTIEDDFVLFYAVSISHISADGLFMPSARLNDDRLYLTYILAKEMNSSVKLLSFLTKIEEGTHLDSPFCKKVPVSAFRLEPIDTGSYITVDGEVIKTSKIQATATSLRTAVIA